MSNIQDWTQVVIKGKSAPKPVTSAKGSVHISNEAARLRKVESDESYKPKTLDPQSRHEMILRRVANKWTQDDLNRQCAFPNNTIREIEASRHTPTSSQLNALNRVLKCGLKLS
jgi:hypothetical protein